MERTVDILIGISIYSAVITAFILLFRAIFKKRISPKVQYAMWLLLVLRLMLPVTIESGFHVESLLPERSAPVVQEESIFDSLVISEIPAVNMSPVTDVAPVQPDFDTQGEELAPAVSQEIPESTVAAVPEAKEPVIDINWRIAAFWTWVAGALVFGLWMMIVKLRFYEDMQRHTASVSPRVYAIYDECCAALGVKPITMWAVDRAISPGIAFFTYPVLLLPASMDGDEEKLRYAFLHELTHKKRRDHYMTALLTGLRIIYWFNPAVHIGFSEMRADMETACDAEVIAFVGKEQKRGYLTAILELFSYATRPQLGMSQASSRRMAKQRMKGAFMRERTTLLGRAAALMLAVIMLMGCFTTACQSAPVEVEEAPELEVVNAQTEPLIDIDGDGLEDAITVDTDNTADENFAPETAKATLTVKLGSGETITQEIPGWWQNAEYHTADFDADNRTDIALMLWVGGSNYDATNVYVYHMGNSKLTELAKNVITNDTITYDQSRYSALNGENTHWVSGGTVISEGGKSKLRLRQLLDYDPGAGIATAYYTNLVWNGSGWFIESMEIGEAYGEEQVYPDTLQYAPVPPDPIDTLSDMDLLTYAALEQGNGTYALPRTLSGNDLATEIWDRIMINVNNQYFSSMPYDAAGAAYNVVAVTQDANSGIIDVYTILTYRRYTILNDELSVDGELNCAVIWQYKEKENGEIEFSNVYWPIKDSKGRVSYGNREWPDDLQKYTDFSPDSIGRVERLKAIDEQIAISMDNTTNVATLLGIITSSPKGSSARIDYIKEHVGEYGQLCAMGRRAVSRFMPRFEKGYETGLEGQIMAAVLNALIGVDSLNDYENSQAWYDASRNEILAYMRLPDEKAALREAILRLYPLADEIAAKGFEAKVDAVFYKKTEALAQTMGMELIGAGKSGSKKQPGCTIEIPDANCSMELCNMYAAVMFAAVPNLNEVTVGNTDYFNYNYHRTEDWEQLLPAVVGDNISRDEAEEYWSGLKKPLLEEYGSSGSGIRELLSELANLSGINLASAGAVQDTPLHVSLLQPTPAPTPTPAPATGKHEWRAGKLAIEPYRDNDTSLLELSHYGITLSGNGTEQTESMRGSKVSNDVYSRDGQKLLEVMRVPRGTLKLDVDLIQHSAENTKWNQDSETYGAVEYTPTWLPGHNNRVVRMTRRYEKGTENSIPYVTTIYSVQIQYNKSDVVLMFRFLNAKKIKGEWQLYQTDYDCEKWMRTFQINGAPNSIVDRAKTLVGKPYKKGTYGPDAFDSAGFVYYVITQAGVYVERLENCQKYADNANWQKIEDKAELKSGDILFFYSDDFTEINHAGIYIGNSKMIDASSANGKVTERSCNTDYWQEHFAFARRVA